MADEPSYSGLVKDELAHLLPELPCCQRMELAALLRTCGRITIGGGGRLSATLVTNHSPVARLIIRLVKGQFGLKTETLVLRSRRLRKNLMYRVRIPPQPGVLEMLKTAGAVDSEGNLTDWAILKSLIQDHCRKAYLRGAFLGNGWISSPDKQHHMEMTATSAEAADSLGQMLFRYGIPVRMVYRKDSFVLYLKDAEHVARFLNVVGAHQALLRYEDVRAMKALRNDANRKANAETANMDKTAVAAARQVAVLERLRVSGQLERVSPSLKELALLRIAHPEVSLKELGEMCYPPVGKSGVNHRMRLLMSLAEADQI